MIYLKLLLTAAFWGGTFVSGRMLAADVPPSSAAFLRFALASVFLFALTIKQEGGLPRLSRQQILPIILLGFTGVFAYNILFFKGLKLVSAGRAALIIATNPIFITLFSVFIFKERLGFVQAVGIMLSVAGAILVISRGNLVLLFDTGIGWGEALIFGCVASWVSFSLIGKAVLSDLSPLVSVTYASAVGTAALFVPACLEGITQNITHYAMVDWGNIAYLALFGTVIGFIWYYQGIQAIGASRAGLFINFVPVSAIILAFFILGETLTASLVLGALLVSGGVALTNSKIGLKEKSR